MPVSINIGYTTYLDLYFKWSGRENTLWGKKIKSLWKRIAEGAAKILVWENLKLSRVIMSSFFIFGCKDDCDDGFQPCMNHCDGDDCYLQCANELHECKTSESYDNSN